MDQLEICGNCAKYIPLNNTPGKGICDENCSHLPQTAYILGRALVDPRVDSCEGWGKKKKNLEDVALIFSLLNADGA